jgi:hypothetical protein
MNDPKQMEQCSGARDQEIRAALDQHWAAPASRVQWVERMDR